MRSVCEYPPTREPAGTGSGATSTGRVLPLAPSPPTPGAHQNGYHAGIRAQCGALSSLRGTILCDVMVPDRRPGD